MHESENARWRDRISCKSDFHNFHWSGFVYIVINTDMCSYFFHIVLSRNRAFVFYVFLFFPYLTFLLTLLQSHFYRIVALYPGCEKSHTYSAQSRCLPIVHSCYRTIIPSPYRAIVFINCNAIFKTADRHFHCFHHQKDLRLCLVPDPEGYYPVSFLYLH